MIVSIISYVKAFTKQSQSECANYYTQPSPSTSSSTRVSSTFNSLIHLQHATASVNRHIHLLQVHPPKPASVNRHIHLLQVHPPPTASVNRHIHLLQLHPPPTGSVNSLVHLRQPNVSSFMCTIRSFVASIIPGLSITC